MAAEPQHLQDREQLLDDVVAAYLDAVENEGRQDAQRWLDRHPELADDLREFFADEDRFGSLMAPLREAVLSSKSLTVGHGSATPRDGTRLNGPLTPASLGEYEILEEIARGGMGVVFKARQRRLQRQVALKMILAGDLATPDAVQRFRFEAETVAGLDHPHIVPIYDIGEDQNRHYFAMKLIDGSSLTRHIQRLRDDPEAAARLLATVARAVDYAHRRGLLHRDLKPANILLDEHGRPHVTDFGLAKWVNRASPNPTETGIAVGTPSYMAPEQAAGPHKDLTVAADVYSLGAILYELLTGRPPFKEATPLLTLRAALDTEPPPPRALNPRVPADLEIIALKCLEKDPARRYASAAALADDLERYLNVEPILARPVRTPERFWRWCRRKPIVAALAAALLLSLLAGGGLATWQWQVAEAHAETAEANYHRADEQRTRVERLVMEKEEARKKEEVARQNEGAAHKKEETSYRQARAVINDMVRRLSEGGLRDVPGLEPLRKELLESALRYYEKFLKQRGDDPQLREELALTYFRVGAITNRIGPQEKALAAYQQSQQLFQQLLDAQPDNAKLQAQLADAYINGGQVKQSLNQARAALKDYDRACALLMPLRNHPERGAWAKKSLAIAHTNKGGIQRTLGDLDDSTTTFETTHQLLRELLAKDPKAVHLRADLAVCHINLGVLHAARGDSHKALECYELARSIQLELVKAQPKNLRLQYDLALNQRRVGDRLVTMGRYAEGIQALRAAEQHWRKCAKESPSVADYRSFLAACLRSLGHAERQQRRHAQALPLYLEARGLQEALVKKHSQVAEYHEELARTCFYLAKVHVAQNQRTKSLEPLRRSRDLRVGLLQVNPENLDVRDAHAGTLQELGWVLTELKRPVEGLSAFAEAVAHERIAVERSPHTAGHCTHLHTHYAELVTMLRRLNRVDESLCRAWEAVAFFEQLAEAHGNDLALRREVASSWRHLAEAQLAANDPENALRSMNHATALRQQLVQERPDDWRLRNGLAQNYHTLGTKFYGNPRPAQALRCYELARYHQEIVVAVQPDNLVMRADLSMFLNNLGITLAQAGQPVAGAEVIRRAIRLQERNLAAAPTVPRYRNALNVYYTALAAALRLDGRLAESLAATCKRREYVGDNPKDLVSMGIDVARLVPMVGTGKMELSQEEQAQRRAYADQAMALLREAVTQGYRDADVLRNHSALAPVRTRPDFHVLLHVVERGR